MSLCRIWYILALQVLHIEEGKIGYDNGIITAFIPASFLSGNLDKKERN